MSVGCDVAECGRGGVGVVAPFYHPSLPDPASAPAPLSPAAFNHILTDVSLVVYQFEALAGFSAVVDRLGEFSEVVTGCRQAVEVWGVLWVMGCG